MFTYLFSIFFDKSGDTFQCFPQIVLAVGIGAADKAFSAGAEGAAGNNKHLFFSKQFFHKFHTCKSGLDRKSTRLNSSH